MFVPSFAFADLPLHAEVPVRFHSRNMKPKFLIAVIGFGFSVLLTSVLSRLGERRRQLPVYVHAITTVSAQPAVAIATATNMRFVRRWMDGLRFVTQRNVPVFCSMPLHAIREPPDELQCIHYDDCSGCTRRGDFQNTPIAMRAKSFFASENVDMKLHISTIHGWRTHVRLAVRPAPDNSSTGAPQIGLYKAFTHEVQPIPECRVHHPRINEVVDFIRLTAAQVGVTGYDDRFGDFRYLQISLERQTNKAQVLLVWNVASYHASGPSLAQLVKRLQTRSDLIHSVTVNFNPQRNNHIINYDPAAWKLLWGPPMITETVLKATFLMRPQIFRQSNLDAFEVGIVPLVASKVPNGSRVAELYSGIGILGLNVCELTSTVEVRCSDSNEYVEEVFDHCVNSLRSSNKEHVFYEKASAADAVKRGHLTNAEVLIVDPPRKGLDPELMHALLSTSGHTKIPSLRRLIYVSCGFAALERDSRALLDSGMWKLASADGFLLFPGADHVETVAVFDRRNFSQVSDGLSISPGQTRDMTKIDPQQGWNGLQPHQGKIKGKLKIIRRRDENQSELSPRRPQDRIGKGRGKGRIATGRGHAQRRKDTINVAPRWGLH